MCKNTLRVFFFFHFYFWNNDSYQTRELKSIGSGPTAPTLPKGAARGPRVSLGRFVPTAPWTKAVADTPRKRDRGSDHEGATPAEGHRADGPGCPRVYRKPLWRPKRKASPGQADLDFQSCSLGAGSGAQCLPWVPNAPRPGLPLLKRLLSDVAPPTPRSPRRAQRFVTAGPETLGSVVFIIWKFSFLIYKIGTSIKRYPPPKLE